MYCQVCAHQSSVFSLVLALRGILRSGSTLNHWRRSVGDSTLSKLFRFALSPNLCLSGLLTESVLEKIQQATSCRKFLNLNLKLLKLRSKFFLFVS